MNQVALMKEEGLNKLIKTLEKILKDQEGFIEGWIKKAPEFGKELVKIADKNFKKAVQNQERLEKKSAEEVLKQLN